MFLYRLVDPASKLHNVVKKQIKYAVLYVTVELWKHNAAVWIKYQIKTQS